VVSFGALGVLGKTGWFCREADVERWNALAGHRGLKDPAVRRYFNGTFLAFTAEWGDEEMRMSGLGLSYDVYYLGADEALDAIRARLDAGLPALFYLWAPHPLNARYGLNRIQLPAYSPERFDEGKSDFPTDVLEKVGSTQLARYAPAVGKMYARFQIDNSAQESMLAAMDAGGVSAMQAACTWMRVKENAAVWRAWIPVEPLTCDPGHYVEGTASCAPCPPGSKSAGGFATACTQCSAGHFMAKSGGTDCFSCDDMGEYFQESPGQTSCTACPENTRRYGGLLSGANRSACQCVEGSFRDDAMAGEECIRCVPGLICSGKLAPPVPIAGFVVSSSSNQHGSPSVRVSACVQCRPAGACAGGAGSPCSEGYTGRRCGICDDGFYVWSGSCKSCGHVGIVYSLALLLVVLVFVLTSFFIWQTLLDPRIGSPVVFMLRLMETLGLMSAMAIAWPAVVLDFLSFVNLANFNTEIFRTECLFGHPHPISKAAITALFPVVLFAAGLLLWPILRVASRRAWKRAADSREGYSGPPQPD
jgi:hypothetical protein